MLRIENIEKMFPGVKALKKVTVDFYEGEIHAILGENGAGKSTLVKIICGLINADKGNIFYNGKDFIVKNYAEAISKGISIVNQERQTFSTKTVAENIMLEKMKDFSTIGFINWKKVFKETKKYIGLLDLDIPPTSLVGNLSSAKKQLVEIAKALATNSKILIFDEPTSSITGKEAERLFGILKSLKKQNVIIIYITHKLKEVFMIADKVTVLRDGELVNTKKIEELNQEEIVKMMIGRKGKKSLYKSLRSSKEKILIVKELACKNYKLENINFHLNKEEILGFYGLVGSGRTEVAKLIVGAEKKDKGEILLNGVKIKTRSISDSLYKHSIGYVTENRKEEGLFLSKDIKTNISVGAWSFMATKIFRFIKDSDEIRISEKMVNDLQIKIISLNQLANQLSGGNQQKVSIAKWLVTRCNVLIIDEPTIGVDIGARESVHNLIYNLVRQGGKSIILISSDLEEIAKLASRILIFNDMKIVGEIDNSNYNYNLVSRNMQHLFY